VSGHPKQAMNLGDIARVAGVSPATVSRVINGSGYASPETRRAVEEAIQKCGYVANAAARALASRRTHTIGALVPSFDNTISSQTVGVFQARIEEAGYVLLLAASGYDKARALRNIEAMVGRGVEAVFIISLFDDTPLLDVLRHRGIPFLTTMPNDRPDTVPFVGYDHRTAGTEIAEFMLRLGHRDLAIVSSQIAGSIRLQERIAAMERTLSAVPGVRVQVREMASTTLAAGRDALRLLQSAGELPSGIIATNDVLAAGMMLESQRQGIRVPDDVSIIGYGDMEIAEHVVPPMTTVRTPKSEIGEIAAQFLISAIDGTPVASEKLGFEIVVRDTTMPKRRT
jgi:LacI family transcriptional regulator